MGKTQRNLYLYEKGNNGSVLKVVECMRLSARGKAIYAMSKASKRKINIDDSFFGGGGALSSGGWNNEAHEELEEWESEREGEIPPLFALEGIKSQKFSNTECESSQKKRFALLWRAFISFTILALSLSFIPRDGFLLSRRRESSSFFLLQILSK